MGKSKFGIGDTVTFYNSKNIKQGSSIVCRIEMNNTYCLIKVFGTWSEGHLITHRKVLLEKAIKNWKSAELWIGEYNTRYGR